MSTAKIEINRAPVLMLWAAVVAERLGYERDEALSIGKAIAELTAQSKGRRLGIIRGVKERPIEMLGQKHDSSLVRFMGRNITARKTPDGVRAVCKGEVQAPSEATQYIEEKFGEHAIEARETMELLARAFTPAELSRRALSLYRKFRPGIPSGTKGWGAQGVLDLAVVAKLAEKVEQS